jgi:hypothetical protein
MINYDLGEIWKETVVDRILPGKNEENHDTKLRIADVLADT